jgi:hypothetical protein
MPVFSEAPNPAGEPDTKQAPRRVPGHFLGRILHPTHHLWHDIANLTRPVGTPS